jgi:protein-tyrosine-phosphatase/predicted ATP-grasp superfamily ATP-dependent carboligase
MHKLEKVLVFGDDTRSFLAVARSLGRQKIEVHAAPFNFSAPALSSRYIKKIHHIPYFLDGGDEWISHMECLLRKEQFRLVIPCDERAILPLMRYQDRIGAFTILAIPDRLAYDAFFDKCKTRELAIKHHVPVAQGRQLKPSDDVKTLISEFGLPLYLKPRKSFSWPELYVRGVGIAIHSEQQLAAWLANSGEDIGNFFVEKAEAGIGLGLSVLCDQGHVLQAFEHHRATEVSGSSYYRKSAPVDPDRLNQVRRIVADVRYTGLAMFEFKADIKSKKWVLLEVNARPWGSLPLPVALGMDFPYWLYKLLVFGETSQPATYRTNVFGRNLIADVWQFRTVCQGMSKRPLQMLSFSAAWLAGFGRLLIGREHLDALVLDDMRPGIVELRTFFASKWEKITFRVSGERGQRAAARSRFSAIISKSRVRNEPTRILFLCQGNINRSPYAEKKSTQRFMNWRRQFQFDSAALLPRNRRHSPVSTVDIAAQRGLDLSKHVAKHAFREFVRASDAVILFDQTNYKYFSERYPDEIDRAFILGDLVSCGEIHDPHGETAEVFNRVYDQIDEGIDQLVALCDVNIKDNESVAA